MIQTIICPNCQTKINLDDIAKQELQKEQEEQRRIFEEQLEKEKEEMRKKAKEFAQKQVERERKKQEAELKFMQEELKKADQELQKSKQKELELLKKQKDLELKEKNLELELEKKMIEERKKLEEKLLKEIEEKQKRNLDEKIKDIQEEYRKKELEYQKQQEQLKKALDDAKRKAEQQSQQIQGDIQENDLKEALQSAFAIDDIEDVPTGIKGADLIQVVKNSIGQKAGIIVWESKNTKSWQDSWIMKLKDDKLKVKGNIAVLVTTVLPKNIENFGMLDDVMVCLPKYAIAVASLLRDKLISINKTQKALEGKDIKMEMLYKYLSSEEFGSKITMMIDVFNNLKAGIDAERRAMEKNWKKREKDLERATFAITGIYGELESLMGQSLIGSEKLELAMGENDE